MKKKILLLLTLAMIFSLSACAKNEEKQEVDALDQQEEIDEDVEEVSEDIKDDVEEEEDNADKDDTGNASDLSDDQWTEMKMVFDGTEINMPVELKKLREIGWEPDYSRTDMNDDYVFNAGDKILGGLSLINDKYHEKFDVSTSFFNPKDEQITMKDAYVYHLILRGDYVYKPIENKPEILLPGNLKWGSTKEEIIEAYGEPDDAPEMVYENEEGKEAKYYVLYYSENFTKNLKLTVYDEHGLQVVDISYSGD